MEGEVKLNIDGARSHQRNTASVGGVICDANGKWILGFAMKVGSCSMLNAKLWAIYKGLTVCWERGCRQVIVESDSMLAVHMLRKQGVNINNHYTLIMSIKRLL